jgi:hypothetical protein
MHFYDHIIITLNKILYNQKILIYNICCAIWIYIKNIYISWYQGGFGVN